MKAMPTIQKFMSAMPFVIERNATIREARDMMRQQGIRHLPVVAGSELVGVLTDRDIKLALDFGKVDDFAVEDAMVDHPYSVTPDHSLDGVVREMAAKKYGCAIVKQKNGRIVGIFTATDALRVLEDTLAAFYRPSPEGSYVARR